MNVLPLREGFKLPVKATDKAAAFDIYMPEPGFYDGITPVKVPLGFAAAIPDGYAVLLLPRSGVGFKRGLELFNTCGLIDADYRGEWFAKIQTKDGTAISWQAGDRLIQAVFIQVPEIELNLVESLDETGRGEGGFGSTGQ